MSNNKVENKDYVSLPYFGLNKLLPYLKPYRYTILSMVALGLLTSSVDSTRWMSLSAKGP